jgi:general secretion pathway protein B
MSYILEALRRAESERERKRGGVPGLHARPVPLPSPEDTGEQRSKPWVWVAGGLSVGVLLMILWRWWSVEPLVDEAALARAPVGGNVSPGSADAPAAAAPPPAPAPAAAPPAPAPAPAEPAAPATPSPAPAPKAAPGRAADKPPRTSKPAAPPRSSATAAAPREPRPTAAPPGAAPVPAPAAQPAPAAPPPERLRTLAELPDDLRRSVPQLAFGGSVYSDTPAQRMVILNGQVMREGDPVTDELQIEQIRPRSAVLRVRGQRFEMPF